MKYDDQKEYWVDPSTGTMRYEFESLYADYADPWGCQSQQNALTKVLFTELLFYNSRYNSILDIGCGLGGYTNQLYQRSKAQSVLGCDVSDTAIKKAQRAYPNIAFVQHSIVHDDAAALGVHDLAVVSDILWYVAEEKLEFINNLTKVLSGKGELGIHQYFPTQQKYAKQYIDGVQGFERLIAETNVFKWGTKLIYEASDGIVLIAKLSRVQS